jgi:hypothetical protein
VTTKTPEPIQHPVDRFLERAPDNEAAAKVRRSQALDALEQFALSLVNNPDMPVPLTMATELSDELMVYLFAHKRGDDLFQRIPEHLQPFAKKAQKHVGAGGEFCLDHALGISDPSFRGARPKGPGEHKHRRLFLMAFHDFEVVGKFSKQIDSLCNAAELLELKGYVEKSLDGEYADWREENRDWLTLVFDLI